MKNTELKDMAIREMLNAMESAELGLDARLEEAHATEEEREKAFEYLSKMQKAFIKRYM